MSFTTRITIAALPQAILSEYASCLSSAYRVKMDGVTYLTAKYTRPVDQKPDGKARVQWWVWYPNGAMWHSFGKTREDALLGAAIAQHGRVA